MSILCISRSVLVVVVVLVIELFARVFDYEDDDEDEDEDDGGAIPVNARRDVGSVGWIELDAALGDPRA